MTAITVESGLKGHKSGYPKHRKPERYLRRKKSGVWAYIPELLGLLLAAAKTDNSQRWAHWKEAGEALLAEKGDAAG